MNNRQIFKIVAHYKNLLKPAYTKPDAGETEPYHPPYSREEVPDFIHHLIEAGSRAHLIFIENNLPEKEFPRYLQEMEVPFIAFAETAEGVVPVCVQAKGKEKWGATFFGEDGGVKNREIAPADIHLYRTTSGNVHFLTAISFDSLLSETSAEQKPDEAFTPVTRLLKLLSTERKDIWYIYVYAIFAGIISLALPLGIQAIIGMISGGLIFSSVILLVGLVILAVLIVGGLQIMQISLVEVLQRRVFTKAAYEFSFRIPRIKVESIREYYAPELMNRFFDILTIQKGLPKLLIDISSASLQIFFGLILLSLYHPFFVIFGIFLLLMLGSIFYFTGSKGLKSSLVESKYKYKVAFWLEELARTLNAFKMAGNTTLPIRKADQYVNSYLHYRHDHFKVLLSQYRYFVLFKTLVTGGLLIIGSLLVVDRQITLGQFVASEIIIILVLNAVEKIITYMDTVYDLLTAVEKIGNVTDLPLERSGGISIPRNYLQGGLQLRVRNLNYQFADGGYALKGVNLDVQSGERIGITGYNQSGKSTLANILAGIFTEFEGAITINGFSYRDLDLINMRDYVAKNISHEDIFDGTILDNLGLGKPAIHYPEIVEAIELVGLSDFINSMPDGLHTHVTSAGQGLPHSVVQKLILARCIVKKPRLLILNDYFGGFAKKEKKRLMQLLSSADRGWTLLAFSNDAVVLKSCQRVVVLEGGKVVAEEPYQVLKHQNLLNEILETGV
ncbi:peptidase domain-containing ABC transporter [Nafulsella turpanensis]|uniref:peptidase domain-containing ABC transporter n=1 Tax=Nafulsella turpanensis TaxID=1265690 RepID=UPI000347D7A0|nr:ATP-binding cassette domain-containing protein [Nafulsella turpanensis]